jgi:hypothetical protein
MFPDLSVWLAHFEYHAARHRHIPGEVPDVLETEERQLIAASIATFQLGEQSGGESLRGAAADYERSHGLTHLARICALWVREEQSHAALLRAFMDDHQIAAKRRDWTDQVFRGLRRLAGFEARIAVLVTAELVGIVYYRALEAATACLRLKLLCRMLVADELAHVAFESDLLLGLRARRSRPVQIVAGLVHRVSLRGTALVVWMTHAALLRRAGYRLRSFLRACDAQYAFYLRAPRIDFGRPVPLTSPKYPRRASARNPS